MPHPNRPPPLGLYDHYEVMSALRKEVKLGDVAAAIYWLNVLLTHGGKSAPALVAKQLWIMAAEDVDDPATVLRAFAVLQMAGRVGEIDHLVFLTAAMCRARKWWQHDDGREVDRAWSQAIGDLKRSPREILDFALQGEQVELQHPDIARLPELCPEEAARESLDPI